MSYQLKIHPSIGVARLGNSPDDFYLAPTRIGGLPIECDPYGNASGNPVQRFKDPAGRMRRQAALFSIYIHKESENFSEELTLDNENVEEMIWTVHLANKKACWYEFEPLLGDDMLDPKNTYQSHHKNGTIHLRNEEESANRQKL